MTYENDGRERVFTGHTGRLFVLLTVIVVCLQLAQRLLPPLLPTIIDDLGITAFLAGVALSLLRLGRASMEYPGGRFADQLSRTTVVLVSLGFGIVGVVALALSTTYAVFLVAVAVLGMALGLYIPSSRTLLSDIFEEKRGRAFGINMVGSDLSGVAAAGIAVWIVSVATWRGAFLPLALVLVPLAVLLARMSREPVRVESVGLGLRETASRVFRTRSIRWLLVVYALFMVATNGVMSFLPTFLIDVQGVSLAFASAAFALVFAVGVVARPVSGVLSDRLPRPLVSGGSLIVTAAGLGLVVYAPVEAAAIAGVVVFAFGLKGVPPALQAYLMDRFPEESMGTDFGAFRAVYKTVGSLGPGYTGFVAHAYGFVPAFTSLLLFFLVGGTILVWFSVFGWPGDA
ncbi:MAG: MFS transporter [Haloferacaceae archaeon]